MCRPSLRAPLATVICALALAGCGGGESGSDADSPLDNALGYLPEDAGFVLAVGTDVDGKQAQAVQKIAERFPFADQLKSGLKSGLREQDVDFDKDVKPLLGNDFVVGAPDVERFGSSDENEDEFVGAIELKDKGKVDALLKKAKAKKIGESEGATLYKDDDGEVFAIEDGVVVVAGSRKLLDAALRQRDAEGRMTEDTFEQGTRGLPDEALARVYVDLQGLLAADPDSAQARKVKWVSALRTLGMSASANDDQISFDFRLGTDGDLGDGDLPFASGDKSPAVLDRRGEVGLGVRDLGQIISFFEATGRALDPSESGEYETGKKALEQQVGINFEDDIFAQLEGDVSTSVTLDGKVGVRAELEDPEAFRQTLIKLGRVVPKLIEGGSGDSVAYARPKGKEGFFALSSGEQTLVYGVVDGVFVLANDSARAGALTGGKPKPVEGAKGAISMRADAAQLLPRAVSLFAGPEGSGGAALFSGPLGELTGSMSAETDGVGGNIRLGFK